MSRFKIPAMALEPSLWGTLPNELLHLVFARLPVAGIGQLRVLSKEWKRNVDSKDSEFNQILNATAPLNMFTLLSWTDFGGISVPGDIYDAQANKWHVYESAVVLEKIVGADGGLVCCVSKRNFRNNKPVFLIVMNPLTKKMTQLPPLLWGAGKTNAQVILVRMVKLTVDRKTKEYKVFVVCAIEYGGRGFFAQVYDSHIKEWTFVEARQGYIIGWEYFGLNSDFTIRCSLCVYNYADGTQQHFNGTNIAPGLKVEQDCCVLLEDHLFVLHKEASLGPANLLEADASVLQKYCISEFHFPEKATAWVKLGVCSCGPCTSFSDKPCGIIDWRLWGCNGFLLVYGDGSKQAWLYNLSTCEWRNLPAFVKPLNLSMMCEISWSAIA